MVDKSGMNLWIHKLVTHEDPFHLHKGLGILTVSSFVWRLSDITLPSDMKFQLYPQYTIPQIALCIMLLITSFQFHIPVKRIKEGSRIWPQARYHTCIFACRSLAMVLLLHVQDVYEFRNSHFLCNYLIQMTAMGFAKLVDWNAGKNFSRSIRDADGPFWGKLIASYMQFRASCMILLGPPRYSVYFMMVIIIIVTPFMGTLRRKNLISHTFFCYFYGLLLGMGLYNQMILLQLPNHLQIQSMICGLVTVLRVGPRFPVVKYIQNNKFVLWTCVFAVLHCVRPNADDDTLPVEYISEEQLRIGNRLGFVALGFTLLYKYRQECQKVGDRKKIKWY